MYRRLFRFACAGLVLTGLLGCDSSAQKQHDYQIVISGSATPNPVEFAGSYTCSSGEVEERTRDIAGSGSMTMSFQCKNLSRVRVQRILGVGMVALTVYKNGEVIFDSPPTDSSAPLLFVEQP